MKILVVAIHGILTRQTDPSWPDRLDAWLAVHLPEARVLKKEYTAGPWPRWNCLVKNPRLALGLANEIRLMLEAARTAESNPSMWIVAHSNGAVVALSTVRRLVAEGHRIAGVILIGAACTGDVARSGILHWLRCGFLGSAFAYCSAEDKTLPGWKSRFAGQVLSSFYDLLAWPYGSLGRTGWNLDGKPFPARPLAGSLAGQIVTRWFGGGHSGYFAPAQIEFTFRQIAHDIQKSIPAPTEEATR